MFFLGNLKKYGNNYSRNREENTMEKLNRFIEIVKDGIVEVLPKDFQGCTFEIKTMQKMDEEYTGMVVMRKNARTHVIINMDDWYDAYLEGTEIDDIIDEIALLVQKEVPMQPLEWLQDYEQVKHRIYYRLYPEDRVTRELKNVPHRKICDLVLAYHILVQDQNGALSSVLVRHEMLEHYGISEEKFHKDAEESTVHLFPESVEQYGKDSDFYIITNKRNLNGASVLFYPGVLEKMAHIYGGTFMLIPSSIHEFFAISRKKYITCEELDEMVEKGNEEVLEQGDILLSTHGYVYDPDHGALETTRAYVERTGMHQI